MMAVPSAADKQVATNTALKSMPVSDKIAGLTNTIYAIVRKVVKPAITSVLTFVLCSFSLKKESSMNVLLNDGWCCLLD
jgi:hypothetical protein